MRFRGLFLIILMILTGSLLVSCDSPEKKYEKYLGRGDSYYQKQDYIKARLEYRNAAKIMPADPRVIYSLGLVEEAEGNLQSALSAFLTAERQDPSFMPVLLKLAEFYLTGHHFQEVSARIDKLLKLDPNHATAHAIKASVLLKEKAFDSAEQEVGIALQNDPANVIAFSVLAGIYDAKGQPEKALEVLAQATSKNRNELSFYLLKAVIYSKQENVAAVTNTYKEIFAVFPDRIQFRFDLARILMEEGQTEEAGKIFRETVQAFPANTEAKRKLAAYLEDKQSTEAAEKEIQSYIHSQPKQKMFLLWLADLYVRNANTEQAITTLKSIIDDGSDDSIGLNASTALAQIQLTKGDAALAEKLISAVLEQDVNNREALYLRANLAFSQGKYQDAVADLRTILSNYPGALKASRILAEALLVQERIDLAVDTLLQAAQKHPEDKNTAVRLAQLYALRGEREKSMEILTNVTKSDPLYPVAWETIIRLAIENKNWAEAEAGVARLSSLDGQEETSNFLKGQIKEGTGQIQEAITLYKAVIQANPTGKLASYALTSLLGMAQTKEQLSEVKNFLQSLSSKSPTVLTVLGATEAALGNSEAAEASFRMAINQNPNTQDAYIALAELLVEQQEPEKANEVLNKAESAIPSEMKAPMMRAALLVESGQIDEAIAIYQGVLDKNNMADVAANNLAQTIADYKHTDKAALDRARLVAERFMNSDNPYYLDTIGWVYYRLGLATQAQPVIARAVSLLKEPHPQIAYHYGALLLENGQKEEAKSYLYQAVSGAEYPGYDDAQEILDKLF